jgi:hypothetical protein
MRSNRGDKRGLASYMPIEDCRCARRDPQQRRSEQTLENEETYAELTVSPTEGRGWPGPGGVSLDSGFDCVRSNCGHGQFGQRSEQRLLGSR